MKGIVTRFLHKAMMEIVHASAKLFRTLYYPRPIKDDDLDAMIRQAIFPGRNIFVVGRTGEGKSCFLRNYIDRNSSIDTGFRPQRAKPIHYFRIYFDSPAWDRSIPDADLVEKVVLNLQKYFRDIGQFPTDFVDTDDPRAKYQKLVRHLNALESEQRSKQLVVIVDDIDHSPIEFQLRFYDAIYPLLRSPACVCVLAVRPPALSTARRRTTGKLATTFADFDAVILRPLSIRKLADYRAERILGDAQLLEEMAEEDLKSSDMKAAYEYLPSRKLDNFIQQFCSGDIRAMSKLLVLFTSYIEEKRSEGEQGALGRTDVLKILARAGMLTDLFDKPNKYGYSLRHSCLELLKFKSRVDDLFYSALSGIGFSREETDAVLVEFYEADLIEEAFVADSYARILSADADLSTEYQLTPRGRWLMTMSKWPQYTTVFPAPKKTLASGGSIFARKVVCEILEYFKELVLAGDAQGPNYFVNWNVLAREFRDFIGGLPARRGAPGVAGFDETQLYRAVEASNIINKQISRYPKLVAINTERFKNACRESGVDCENRNPFWDETYFDNQALTMLLTPTAASDEHPQEV
ncbi:MAG: P-loop NTPase fold protein [Planctomycetota bacterium]|jgi:hypothetical protein